MRHVSRRPGKGGRVEASVVVGSKRSIGIPSPETKPVSILHEKWMGKEDDPLPIGAQAWAYFQGLCLLVLGRVDRFFLRRLGLQNRLDLVTTRHVVKIFAK